MKKNLQTNMEETIDEILSKRLNSFEKAIKNDTNAVLKLKDYLHAEEIAKINTKKDLSRYFKKKEKLIKEYIKLRNSQHEISEENFIKMKYSQAEINNGLINLLEKRLIQLEKAIEGDEICNEVNKCIDAERIAKQENTPDIEIYIERRNKLVEAYNKEKYRK